MPWTLINSIEGLLGVNVCLTKDKTKKYESIRLVFKTAVWVDMAKYWWSLQYLSEEIEADHPVEKQKSRVFVLIDFLWPFCEVACGTIGSSEPLKPELIFSLAIHENVLPGIYWSWCFYSTMYFQPDFYNFPKQPLSNAMFSCNLLHFPATSLLLALFPPYLKCSGFNHWHDLMYCIVKEPLNYHCALSSLTFKRK